MKKFGIIIAIFGITVLSLSLFMAFIQESSQTSPTLWSIRSTSNPDITEIYCSWIQNGVEYYLPIEPSWHQFQWCPSLKNATGTLYVDNKVQFSFIFDNKSVLQEHPYWSLKNETFTYWNDATNQTHIESTLSMYLGDLAIVRFVISTESELAENSQGGN